VVYVTRTRARRRALCRKYLLKQRKFFSQMLQRMRACLHHGVAVEAGKGFQAAQV
jgi:hypothetical protein